MAKTLSKKPDEIEELKEELAKAKEKIEVSNYNNKRLTKRLEEVIRQLKKAVILSSFIEQN